MSGDPRRRRAEELRALGPWLDICFRADDAEARGDASRALELLARRMNGPDGELYWRPWRIRRLMQMAVLGPVLPPWATSRWILDQAMQSMLVEGRRRHELSLRRALEARGVELADLPGRDVIDARCRVMDRDWVYRQSFLYELGGLRAFLDGAAAADLVAGADRIRDWVAAPMAGVRLVSSSPSTVCWERLDAGIRVETANIGSAALIAPGECAIGRLVPAGDQVMFESQPLYVPESVAVAVAHEPANWLGPLTEGFAEHGEPEINLRHHEFGLLHDVPPPVWRAVVAHGGGLFAREDAGGDEVDFLPLTMSCARRLLDGIDPPTPDQVDAWPCLAAALLEPTILRDLVDRGTDEDRCCLDELSEILGEPAASLCRHLAEDERFAA